MREKLRSAKGFTLTEILVVLALMSLLTVAMGAAMPVAARLYQETTAIAEANTLLGTISLALSDELHYASEIRQDENGLHFLSRRFGADASVSAPDGRVTIGGRELFSDMTYMGNVAAVELSYADGIFDVTITISGEKEQLTTGSFQIRPLNAP